MEVSKSIELRGHPRKGNPDLSVKRCCSCHQVKSRTEFHKAGKNGVMPSCKICRKTIAAADYKTNWFVFVCRLKKSFCKKSNIAFDLTPEYLESIYTNSCPVFGTKFEMWNKKSHYSPTLDRLDPSKGYVQGNVCYISHRANRIKYDASVEELKQILGWYERATTISKESTPKQVEAVDPGNAGDDIVCSAQ